MAGFAGSYKFKLIQSERVTSLPQWNGLLGPLVIRMLHPRRALTIARQTTCELR